MRHWFALGTRYQCPVRKKKAPGGAHDSEIFFARRGINLGEDVLCRELLPKFVVQHQGKEKEFDLRQIHGTSCSAGSSWSAATTAGVVLSQ